MQEAKHLELYKRGARDEIHLCTSMTTIHEKSIPKFALLAVHWEITK